MIQDVPTNQNLSFFSAICAIFVSALFGGNAVAIKLTLTGIGVFTSAGLRFSIASAAIIVWALATGRPLKVKKGQLVHLLLLSGIFVIQISMYFTGISKINASRGILLINIQPFLVLFMAHYFIPGDRITGRKVLGIVLGFIGVAFVFIGKNGILAGFQPGDLYVLTAASLWAISVVYIKKVIAVISSYMIVLYSMLFSIPLFFLEGFLFDNAMITHIDATIVMSLLYLSLVTASACFVIWNFMLSKFGAVALNSFVFIMPVSGVLAGGLILGEPITYNLILSLVFIVLGILALHFRLSKKGPPYSYGRNL